jgi:SAM-dependent MidA family methyltransferase
VRWLNFSVLLAADEILLAINASGGALRFDQFMSLALYGQAGFYTRHGQAGRRGDFITSPEIGPLFGSVMARALDDWWRELGCPAPFTVVEVGAGPGTLARAVIAAKPACGEVLHYVAVEVSATQRALHPTGVESRAAMPTEHFVGVIIANELLDNLPFRLFVFDDAWREAYVVWDGLRFAERLKACRELPTCLPTEVAHGARVAVQDAAANWVSDALSLLTAGRLVTFDYTTSTSMMGVRPWREWLRTFVAHGRGVHYLSAVGEQDITVEVALDQLPVASAVTTQAEFLHEFGIATLVDEGRAAWQRAADAPDLAAMVMRSRVREAEALLDPAGLGGFSVVQWHR